MTLDACFGIVSDEVVAACMPWSAVVPAGLQLQIVDLSGNQAVDCLLYAVQNHAQRYSAQTAVRRNATSS